MGSPVSVYVGSGGHCNSFIVQTKHFGVRVKGLMEVHNYSCIKTPNTGHLTV